MKKTTYPSFKEEKKIWEKGYKYVIGIDEVGRGAFAGPVVTGAAVFKKDIDSSLIEHLGIHDSKLLTPQKRKELDKEIRLHSQYYSISEVGVSGINKVGIGKATEMAFRKVLRETRKKLPGGKIFVLVDGFHIKYIKGIGLKNQKAIIKGDRKSISIASASIIAKVYRDNLMKTLSKKYPQYHFDKNKGYGTKEHRNFIKKYGLSKVHRGSFNLQKFT
ncbi:MAG: ribonuclease HII [Patescibacteria group bacterium]|nr:ribonuclease HII [Patescibacteria group bacterium]